MMRSRSHSPPLPLLLLALGAVAVCCLVRGAGASRFMFSLPSRVEECFMEEVDARTSDNKLLFRFGIVDPELYDTMDVTIKSPSWKIVESWNRTQAAHVTSMVRETGLYHLCFRKRAGASKDFQVYYSFDFISTGSRNMVLYPNLAATVDRATPDAAIYTTMMFATAKGAATRMGILDYALTGISSSLIKPNTRVQLLLTIEYLTRTKVDLSIARYPGKIEYPMNWDSLARYTKDAGYKEHVFDNAMTELGSHVAFDVTEMVANALSSGDDTLTFTIHANEDAGGTAMGMSYTTPDYYPQLIVEDMGLDLMREVGVFKERVFTLKGELTYIKQKERRSRNAADSANSRVKWLSFLTNVVLIWIAMGQVLYIRKMLENSY